jgi:glycerophosphoryl diester phosphodiesterase
MINKPFLCIGHRGAMGYEPENTLLSIRRAIEMGCDYVEIDVYLIDGQLIVIHDDTLERTTNGKGSFKNQTFAYLRSLDAGKGERIPTLIEVFALIDRRIGIIIELKCAGTAVPVTALIEKCLCAGWQLESIIVSSFDHQELCIFKVLAPNVPVGVLIDGMPKQNIAFAKHLQAFSVHPAIDFVDQEFVNDAHRQQLRVFPYTVNHPDDIRRMRTLGVDGVFTDFPDRVLADRT